MNKRFTYILKRGTAYFIDVTVIYLVVMLVLQLLILVPVRNYLGITEDWFRIGWNVQWYVWLTISLPTWSYFILSESLKYKATVGKRLFKLKVIDSKTNSRITMLKSVLRTALKLLPWELIHIGLNLPKPVWFEANPEFRYLTLLGSILFLVYFISLVISPKLKIMYDKLLGTCVDLT